MVLGEKVERKEIESEWERERRRRRRVGYKFGTKNTSIACMTLYHVIWSHWSASGYPLS